jgi:hypothetical protein
MKLTASLRSGIESIVDLWEQRPDESSQAYRAFAIYRDLGIDRSIAAAYRQSTKKPKQLPSGRWKAWSARYQWDSRAKAYDAHLHAIEQRAREVEIAKRATEIERRRQVAQDSSWALFEELKAKLQQMLKLPVISVTDSDGKKTVNPAKWDYNSVARALEAMTKLAKLGAGLDSGVITNLNIDWDSLTEEQIERIAAGEDPARVIASTRKSSA